MNAAITGMRIAEQTLRTYHIRGRQDDPRQLASDKGHWIYDSLWKATWALFKEENCFKNLGVWYDTTEKEKQGTQLELINQELQTMLRRIRSARGSAKAIAEVLRGALIAKVAYYGGHS